MTVGPRGLYIANGGLLRKPPGDIRRVAAPMRKRRILNVLCCLSTIRGHDAMIKRVISGLVLGMLLAGAALAGLELALRFIGLGDPVVYYTNLTYRFALVPDQKVVRPGGKVITINDRGLRATRPWAAPADLRILFFGDSVTWGTSSVGDADTFSERTCAVVGRALGVRATCGNAGINAYGTDNMAQRILHGGIDDEDWIVAVILSGDAIRSLQNINAGHYHMVKPTGPLRATWEALTYGSARLAFMLRGDNDREPPDHALLVARDSVRNLMNVLRDKQRQGRKVLVALTVGRPEIEGPEFAFTPVVRDEIERSGLPFLDLAPVIKAHFRPDFYLDTAHLTPYGNGVFADAIAARIVAAERAGQAPGAGTIGK